MNTKGLLIVCMACLSTSAWAIEPGPSSAPQKGTEQWMQLQIRGVVASLFDKLHRSLSVTCPSSAG